MKFLKIMIVLGLFNCSAFSQKISQNDYSLIDEKALAIPNSITKSTDGLAKYFDSNFQSDKEKVRAAFVWVASNISYDTNYSFDTSENRNDKIEKSLKNRKGVCENYAALFTEICNKIGIKSYVVEGYTKQNSKIIEESHAWSAANIDGSWFIFDPTWSSGYIENGKFVQNLNNTYFLQSPEKAICTHMSFDYLWQFSNQPISNQDFYDGKVTSSSKVKNFNFEQALMLYEAQNYLSKLKSSAVRIQENGLTNALIKRHYLYLETSIDHIHQNKVITLYNAAAAHYNQALTAYNDFVDIRNKNNGNRRSTNSLEKMVAKAEIDIKSAKEILKSLPVANSKTTLAANQLMQSVASVSIDVQKQKLWLRKYLMDGSTISK